MSGRVFALALTHASNYSPDNTFEVFFNGESQKSGSLLEDFEPPVNPSKEIDDPEDTKPEDWVDTKRISDPDATKVERSPRSGCHVTHSILA